MSIGRDTLNPPVIPENYARDEREDGRALTNVINSATINQRTLAVLFRIEDLLIEIRDQGKAADVAEIKPRKPRTSKSTEDSPEVV